MEPSPVYAPRPAPSAGSPRWVAPTVLALAGVWAVGWTVLGQAGSWLVGQILVIEGYARPAIYWPGLTVLIALVAGVPAALAALAIRRPTCRAIAKVWTAAAGFAAVLGLVRVVPWTAGDATIAGLGALVMGLLALLVRRRERRRIGMDTRLQPAGGPRAGGLDAVAALAAGLAGTVPWWWAGSLGGPFDVLAAALTALALGALVSGLRRAGLARVPAGGPVGGLILDALIVAVVLTLLAGAVGAPGDQLPLLVILPVAALAVAATDPERLLPATLLVAAVAFGPLAFVDAEEVTLLLLPGDVPGWASTATGISALVLLAAGVAAAAVAVRAGRPRATRVPKRAVAGLALAVVVLASTFVWLGAGEPGFHGDRLFVVLNSQADVSAAARSTDLTARRKAVYQELVAHARRTQGPLLRALRRAGADPTPFYLVNAVEVDDNPAVRALLATRDDVASVRPSPELRPVPSLPTVEKSAVSRVAATPANLVTIKAPQAWAEGADGHGIVVGFSDSGVDAEHPALKAGYRGGSGSWYDPWNHTSTPTDPNGHGTHTAASAVGRQVGVAPGASWIGCANLARPLANPGYYVSCLQFMLAPFRVGGNPFTDGDPAKAADVLNNSWGCPTEEGCSAGTLKAAVDGLTAAGIFVVSAAGNTGPHCDSITDPLANYPKTFTVGATQGVGPIADFSSRGSATGDTAAKPDIVAPGVDVLSAWPGGGYKRLSGTSMASPQVAGVVALMWQVAPVLRGNIPRTAALLRTSAAKVSEPSNTATCYGNTRSVIGAGLVDAAAAVDLARHLDPTPR